jgi:hypothetical protein
MILRISKGLALFFLLLIGSCVDRIDFDVELKSNFPIVIEGYISDQHGPFTINISHAFDIDSKSTMKTPAKVKEIILLDNNGNVEQLTELEVGVYRTNENGIKGKVGNAYRLRITLMNEAVFESIPDTMNAPGHLDSLYYKLVNTGVSLENSGSDYSYDFYFDGSKGQNDKPYFLWKFIGTFKCDTHPELDARDGEPCGFPDCQGCSICNNVWRCSGLRNIGSPKYPTYINYEPCSCCTCWYTIYNNQPILSNVEFVRASSSKGIKAGSIPVNDYTFQNKIYAEVIQLSLSHQAFNYYKSIANQKEAINSLFQPVSGKIKSNFIQISGPESTVEGFFYAATLSSKRISLTKKDVPKGTYQFLPEDQPLIIAKNCTKLFPNSSNVKPDFWED